MAPDPSVFPSSRDQNISPGSEITLLSAFAPWEVHGEMVSAINAPSNLKNSQDPRFGAEGIPDTPKSNPLILLMRKLKPREAK